MLDLLINFFIQFSMLPFGSKIDVCDSSKILLILKYFNHSGLVWLKVVGLEYFFFFFFLRDNVIQVTSLVGT